MLDIQCMIYCMCIQKMPCLFVTHTCMKIWILSTAFDNTEEAVKESIKNSLLYGHYIPYQNYKFCFKMYTICNAPIVVKQLYVHG